jgi:hypothetical protein
VLVSLLFDALDWLQKAVWPVHTLESVLKHFEIYIPQTRFLGLNVMISKMLGASVEIWLWSGSDWALLCSQPSPP